MNSKYNLIQSILILTSQVISGQELLFDQLTIKEGLPYNHITELVQDKQGFLWIGTDDGLIRYDGRTYKEFRRVQGDTLSLSNNDIRSLFIDNSGCLWVGTGSGLNVFYPEKESFQRFVNTDPEAYMAKNYILDVLVDQLGQVWYCTYNGLYMMEPDLKGIHHFKSDSNNQFSIPDIVVWKVFEDMKGRLWFGTNNGLAIYNNDGTFNFIYYKPDYDNDSGLKTDRVWAFCQQSDSTIWLGSYDGLFRIDEMDGNLSFTRFCNDPENENSLSYNFIEALTVGPDNTIYAGTWNGGLNEIKTGNGATQFTRYNVSQIKPYGISHNNVTSCLIDRSGVLWAGTVAGLNRASLKGEKFISINNNNITINSGRKLHVTAILSDENKDLWIGTQGDGLLHFENAALSRFDYSCTVYKKDRNSSLSHNNIYGLFQDTHGELWVNTYNAVNRIRFNGNGQPEWRNIYNNDDGLPHNFTFNILQENDTTYWIATYGQLSMMTLDPKDRNQISFRNFDMNPERDDALVNSLTYSLCLDKYGQLWIGSFGGLSKLLSTVGEGVFENYTYNTEDNNGIGGSQVGILYCDSEGRMWAGTEGGLSYFDQRSESDLVQFKTFGIESGLPNDVIKAILEDDKGNLWLSTNRGLAVFDPKRAFSGETPVIKSYNANDGLQGNVFNFRAAFKDPSGIMYFGGTEGFTIIDPDNIYKNTNPPMIAFTDFKLFNKSVNPNDSARSILKRSINYTDTIKLLHWQNNFTIEFAALDFVKPEKNNYAYYLEGFDKDWIFSGERNFATYTRLSAGEYMFYAKGTNNDGIWSETPAKVLIISLPPVWKTWWAFLFYVIIFILGVLLFIRFRIKVGMHEIEKKKEIELARYEEREQLRRKNAADFHDELGHRLTKISLFLELARRESDVHVSLKEYLNKVKENTTGLSDGIRDLIWTIDPRNDNLYEILVRLRDFGDQLFEFSDITFRTSGITSELKKYEIKAEARKHILLLFKEAMNNSLKYSNAKNTNFTISDNEKNIEIIFKDDGKGFEISGVKKGYGLKNINDRAEKAGASLSISSAIEKGTIIKMNLNLKN